MPVNLVVVLPVRGEHVLLELTAHRPDRVTISGLGRVRVGFGSSGSRSIGVSVLALSTYSPGRGYGLVGVRVRVRVRVRVGVRVIVRFIVRVMVRVTVRV